jgi:predicted nucleic acid-binding protein
MSGKKEIRRLLILDACVLIDFLQADRSLFRSTGCDVFSFYVVSSVIEELHDIEGVDELTALGISVIEPALDDAYKAAEQRGALSFQDWLCLLTAKRHGFICVTNDRALRRHCEKEGVALLWGLEMLLALRQASEISTSCAEEIAFHIHTTNSRHISIRIFEEFKEKLQTMKNRDL